MRAIQSLNKWTRLIEAASDPIRRTAGGLLIRKGWRGETRESERERWKRKG